jgi:hypothetical protein
MKKCFLLLWFFLYFFGNIHAQQKISISGYLKDTTNGETLIGASVYVKNLKTGTQANEYGYFVITVPPGQYTLVFSYPGFTTSERNVDARANVNLNISMKPLGKLEKEVVISSDRTNRNVTSTEMSKLEISGNTVKELPVIMGEPDILKAITLLPGIKSGGEASTGFYVRGGGPDQNLVLMDEGVIYNPSHLLGFLSVFNTDAVRNVEIIKGGMPAQYGGRLSSILNVNMKEGNNQKFEGSGGIGLISSRLSFEGPIKKNKSSFMVAGRRTYIDALVRPFLADSISGNGYYFYDFNVKANYILSDKDRLYFSGYYGRDVFSFVSPQNTEIKFGISWGNNLASLRWNHVFNQKLFSNLSLVYNEYNLNNRFEFGQNDFKIEFTARTGIRDWNAKYDLQHLISDKHKLKYGIHYTFHVFQPGIANGQAGTTNIDNSVQNQYAHESAIYFQDEWKVNSRLSFNLGLRYVIFNSVGPFSELLFNDENVQTGVGRTWKPNETIAFYDGWEPRAAGTFLLNAESSIKASFTQTYQFLHLATTSGAAFPADLWIPSSRNVKPQQAFQYAIGYFRNFKQNEYESSIEAYYKPMFNQIEFEPGTQLFFNKNLESSVIPGQGLSYGLEFFFKKKFGKTTGWIGYTWSRTTRQFDELNNGEAFFYRYDRTHDFSFVLSQNLSKKWNMNIVFVYGTGNAVTLPTARMPFRVGIHVPSGEPRFQFIDLYEKINAFRLPAYHRADVSFTYMHKKTEKWESSWNFSIYNVYNRANPFFIYFYPDIEAAEVKAYMVYLFPILPSIAWNFKF